MTSQQPRLGPAWRSNASGGRGFQPPPAVPDASSKQHQQQHGGGDHGRDRSGSHASGGSSGRNPFSLLDDDADEIVSGGGGGGSTATSTSSRFANLRSSGPSYNRSASTGTATSSGGKPGGRSLADLAAAAGLGSGGGERGGEGRPTSSSGLSRSSSTGYHGSSGGHTQRGRGGSGDHGDGFGSNSSGGNVIRYTREKLLSLRPVPKGGEGLPDVLRALEGSVCVSDAAQDPGECFFGEWLVGWCWLSLWILLAMHFICSFQTLLFHPSLISTHFPISPSTLSLSPTLTVCWDDFDPEEIWASAAARERRSGGPPPSKAPESRGSSGRNLRDLDDDGGIGRSGSRTIPRESSGGGFGGGVGRWQRGVALPADDGRGSGGRGSSNRDVDANNPDDLWDDPTGGGGGTGAAADFSAFGGSLEDDSLPKGKTGMSGAFELSDMSKAAAAFEAELHGDKKSNGENEDAGDDGNYTHTVDPSRPLASTGTTIRSGSGNHVNVFEDFGDDDDEAPGDELAVKSGNEVSDASSRLMKMIGVSGSGGNAAPNEAAAPASENKPDEEAASIPSNPWGAAPSIPSNPWGEPASSGDSQRGSSFGNQQAREAEVAAQRQQEELRRRRQQEEEEQKRWAEMQAKQQAELQAQQQQARLQQQSQVELVLIERISNILEASWGRSDLASILATLHAEDSRVIAILSTGNALRALIARHPQRIALVRDPQLGAEMAALVLSNQQWQARQAQMAQQQQAQNQAREQELRQQQEALVRAQQQRQQQEAIARAQVAQAREAQERHMQQQQNQSQTVIKDAPWFYADPQGNIQVCC